MQKIPEALRDVIQANSALEFGFAHNLFNVTQLARFLQPLIRARVGKEVSTSALCMAIGRLTPSLPKGAKQTVDRFKFKNLSLRPDLLVLTLPKDEETHKAVNVLHSKTLRRGGHFCVTEGHHQITVIIDEQDLDHARSTIGSPGLLKPIRASSISVSFDTKYLSTPGFLYLVLQQVALQGINILELSSTATELVLYVHPGQVTLAFDTLYERFMRKRGE